MDIAQVSFSKGEVSPLAADRTDEQFYAISLQTCVNFFITAEGAAVNRPGLQNIGQSLTNMPAGSYLLPFIYNNQQTYVVEFSAGALQFYSQGAFIQNQATVAILTNVTVGFGLHAATLTYTATNSFSVGNTVIVSGIVSTGTFNANGIWTISSVSPTQFVVVIPWIGGGGSFSYHGGGSAGINLNLTNPYALADLPALRWAQSADVLSVVVQTHPMYQLTRVTATSFTFTAPQLLFGPFQDINTDGTTTVYASAVQGTVTLTASAPIFKPAHVGDLFSIQEQFLDSIQPWEAQKILCKTGDPIGTYCRSDGKIYLCVDFRNPGGDTIFCTGTFQPVHSSGTQYDGNGGGVTGLGACGVAWQFVSTDTGIALITQYVSATQVKATIQSHKGTYSNFPPTVVGGPQTVQGPFLFNGDGSTTTFTPLTGITTADPNQFYVTVGGVFQDPSTYSINLTSTNITFFSAPATGTNNISVAQVVGTLDNLYGAPPVTPMTGLCLSTYWAFGSLSSIQGYASEICYYSDRLVLAASALQPQTMWTSQVSNYLDFGFSNPQVDSDAITETINSRQQNPINNLLPMNNLLLGTASASWRATDSSGIGSITPSNIALIPQEFYGIHPIPAVQTGTTIIYPQWGGRKLRDIIYNFYNDKFQGQELTVFARQMFPYGTQIVRIAFAPEPYGLVYCVRSDGVMCVCAYLPEQQVIAWSRYTTQGNFEDVCVVPENNAFSVYVIVGRTLNGAYTRSIERFSSREFTDTDDAFFVDCGLTYDGRNTGTATMTVSGGTTWTSQDTGTVLSGTPVFSSTDPQNNNAVWLTDAQGNLVCRLQVIGYLGPEVAQVLFLDPVPAAYRNTAVTTWSYARTSFSGLGNLANQTISILADSSVLAQQVVTAAGTFTLPVAAAVVHAGLPYVSQLQSLNLNLQGQESIRNHRKTIPRVSVVVDESYPFEMGPDFDHLVPVIQRQFESYTQPIQPHTGVLSVQLPTIPADDAYVCLEMSDPAPVRVLGWLADVDVGEAQ